MSKSSILQVIAVIIGIGVVVKTAIVGFYITEVPWIVVGAGAAWACFKLSERFEEEEAQDRNRDEQERSGGTDNW